jgi:carboxylesterase type B
MRADRLNGNKCNSRLVKHKNKLSHNSHNQIIVAKLGDEDCLHINVFVPRENPTSQDKLDVIVHIHGGAYMYGSGLMFTPA